jgi:hypothetical protein
MSSTASPTSGRSLPGEGDRYTPVSALAVAALIVSSVGALVIAGMYIAAQVSGKPAYQPLLLLPMLLGLGLALAAKWQIRNSEGARTGAGFASSALWLCLIVGGVYLIYIVTLELAIRDQARKFTNEWAKKVATGPVELAFLDVLSPAQRASVDEKDIAAIRQRFATELHPFKINEIVRLLQRAGSNYELVPMGLKNWELIEGGLLVQQIYELRTPEGRFEVLLPVYGRDIPELGGRQWLVQLRAADIRNRQTTSLGRLALDMQYETRRFLFDWAEKINRGKLFDAFLDTLPMNQRASFKGKTDAPEFQKFKDGAFIYQDGEPLPPEAQKKAAENVLRPFSLDLSPGTAQAQAGPPLIEFRDDGVWLIVLIEVKQGDNVYPIPSYITVELQGDEMIAEILKMRKSDWRQLPILPPVTRDSTQEADRFPNRGFRIVNINLKPSEPRLIAPFMPGGRQGNTP